MFTSCPLMMSMLRLPKTLRGVLFDVLQVMVMATLSAAFTRLANNRKLLLPTVHKIWPVVMNRIKEQKQLLLQSFSPSDSPLESSSSMGRISFLLPYLLDFVSLLSILCGDFLSLKLKVGARCTLFASLFDCHYRKTFFQRF